MPSPSYFGELNGAACEALPEYQRNISLLVASETGASANFLVTGSVCQTPALRPNCVPNQKPYCPVLMPAESYGVRPIVISSPGPPHLCSSSRGSFKPIDS